MTHRSLVCCASMAEGVTASIEAAASSISGPNRCTSNTLLSANGVLAQVTIHELLHELNALELTQSRVLGDMAVER